MKIGVIAGLIVVVGIIGGLCGAGFAVYEYYRRRAGGSTRRSSV